MAIQRDRQIFRYGENQWVTCGELLDALRLVGAHECDVLFLHTGMEFGAVQGLKRKEVSEIIYEILLELGVKTLVFPTFSFSFANKKDYDVVNSRSSMGILNEYVRKREDSIRSMDPLLSVCVVGENKFLAEVSGDSSLGKGSFFDRLHQTENAKIAFFGVDEIACNTHVHYVEQCMNVPYRYELEMSGKIIDNNGKCVDATHKLFVTYKDVQPDVPREFYQEMMDENKMKKVVVGKASVSCFGERDAYEKARQWLERDINCFIKKTYTELPLVKEFEYGNVVAVI